MPRPHHRSAGRLLAAAALAVTLLLAAGGGAATRPSADELQQKQQQRNQVASIMAQLRQAIATAQDQEAALRAAIAGLDSQIAQTEQQVTAAQARLDRVTTDMALTQAHLDDTRARLARDRDNLAQQVVMIYKLGADSAVNDLLGSEGFNQFWQKLIDLRRVSGTQETVLTAVRVEEASVRADLARVTAERAQQAQVLSQLRTQVSNLDTELAARQQWEAQLQAAQAQDQVRLAQAEQSARELDQQIAAIKAAMARAHGTGRFQWPEVGPITQGFGCTPYVFEPFDPNCPTLHFHTGIDIAGPDGNPVAAADGGIAYTYYSSYGYGNHVIIVHGNGWMSVYGHLQGFAVGNGQTVGRGQTIGWEGSTGNSTGPHLHFEIRLNGVPQNPLAYLP